MKDVWGDRWIFALPPTRKPILRSFTRQDSTRADQKLLGDRQSPASVQKAAVEWNDVRCRLDNCCSGRSYSRHANYSNGALEITAFDTRPAQMYGISMSILVVAAYRGQNVGCRLGGLRMTPLTAGFGNINLHSRPYVCRR